MLYRCCTHNFRNTIRRFCVDNTLKNLENKVEPDSIEAFTNTIDTIIDLSNQNKVPEANHLLKKINQKLLYLPDFDRSKQGELYRNLAYVSNKLQDYNLAIEYFKKAYDIYIKDLPATLSESFLCCIELGNNLLILGQFSKADEYVSALLPMSENLTNQSFKAIYYECMGRVKNSIGNHEEALKYLQKATEILTTRKYPDNGPDIDLDAIKQKITLELFQLLGSCYITMGEINHYKKNIHEAKYCISKGIEIFSKTLDSTYLGLLQVHIKLIVIYVQLKLYHEMHKSLDNMTDNLLSISSGRADCIQIKKNIDSVNHFVVTELYNIKEFEHCRLILQKNLKLCLQHFEYDHEIIATTYHRLSQIYLKLKNYKLAVINADYSLESRTKLSDSSMVIYSYILLAETYYNIGDFEYCQTYIDKSDDLLSKYPSTKLKIVICKQYFLLYFKKNELKLAKDYGLLCEKLIIQDQGVNSKDCITAYEDLSAVCSLLQEYEESLKYVNQAISISKAIYGPQDIVTVKLLKRIGNIYELNGNTHEAIQSYTEILNNEERIYGSDSLELYQSLNSLIRLFIELKNFSQAIELAEKKLSISKSNYGEIHATTAKCYFVFAEIYKLMQNDDLHLKFLNKGNEILSSIPEK